MPSTLQTNTSIGKGERMSIASLYAHEGPGSTASTPLNPLRRARRDDDDPLTPASAKRSRSKRPKRESSANRSSTHQQPRLILKTKMDQTPDAVSPAPPGSGHPVLNQYAPEGSTPNVQLPPRRPRPLTQHQLAVEQNRKDRIDYLLSQQRTKTLKAFRDFRLNEEPFFSRTGQLLQDLPSGYDTDDENSWGMGGVCPNPNEGEDYGEAAGYYQSVLRKAGRRLDRWDRVRLPGAGKDLDGKKGDGKGGRQKVEKENGVEAGGKKPAPKRTRVRKPRPKAGAARDRSKAAVAARAAKRAAEAAAKAAAANGHVSSPEPPSRPAPRNEVDDDDEELDDIDKELLGELSADDQPPPPPTPPPRVSRPPPPPTNGRLSGPQLLHTPVPYGDESSFMDGDGYSSLSEREGPEHEHGHDREHDQREDEEMMDDADSSVYQGPNRNGYMSATPSDVEQERERGGDEDELMLGV